MQPVNEDKWLDEALEGVLHSNDTRPDFQKWMARHPEAVETLTAPKTRDRSVTKTIRLNAWFGQTRGGRRPSPSSPLSVSLS